MEEYIFSVNDGTDTCWYKFIKYFLDKSESEDGGPTPQDMADEYLEMFNATVYAELDSDSRFIFRFETTEDMTRFIMTWS